MLHYWCLNRLYTSARLVPSIPDCILGPAQGRTSTGCKGKAAQPERLSVGQESTGAGSKPSLGEYQVSLLQSDKLAHFFVLLC